MVLSNLPSDNSGYRPGVLWNVSLYTCTACLHCQQRHIVYQWSCWPLLLNTSRTVLIYVSLNLFWFQNLSCVKLVKLFHWQHTYNVHTNDQLPVSQATMYLRLWKTQSYLARSIINSPNIFGIFNRFIGTYLVLLRLAVSSKEAYNLPVPGILQLSHSSWALSELWLRRWHP